MADATLRAAARTAALVAVPVAVLAGLLVYWVLGGFRTAGPAAPPATNTAPVQMPAPSLSARPAAVCRALLAELPDRLGDLDRRPVTAGGEQNAAYGDPPVTVACGVPGPSPVPTAQLFLINGLCWYAEQRAGAAVWALQGREVPVVVTVPASYAGPSRFAVDLAGPVSAAVPETAPACR
jgi:hypothetical protein